MILKKLMKACSRTLLFLYESSLFRYFARFLVQHFKLRNCYLDNVQGHKMYAHSLDRIVTLFFWKFSALEDVESSLLHNFIKEGMVVVDIGGNIGYYTLQFAKLVGPKGKVFVFEPDPDNYSTLVKNIKSNNYENIIPVQKAVSNKTGRANLFFCEENTGDHRIFDSQDGRNSIEIDTIALDEFFPVNERINFIKIDIQGAEYLAFLGMEKLIQRNKRLTIICEFAPYLLVKCGISSEQFINKIIDYGFKLQFINEKKKCIEPVAGNRLKNMCDGKKYINLFLEK